MSEYPPAQHARVTRTKQSESLRSVSPVLRRSGYSVRARVYFTKAVGDLTSVNTQRTEPTPYNIKVLMSFNFLLAEQTMTCNSESVSEPGWTESVQTLTVIR